MWPRSLLPASWCETPQDSFLLHDLASALAATSTFSWTFILARRTVEGLDNTCTLDSMHVPTPLPIYHSCAGACGSSHHPPPPPSSSVRSSPPPITYFPPGPSPRPLSCELGLEFGSIRPDASAGSWRDCTRGAGEGKPRWGQTQPFVAAGTRSGRKRVAYGLVSAVVQEDRS